MPSQSPKTAEVDSLRELLDPRAVQGLGADVRRVLRAGLAVELQLSVSLAVLDAEVARAKVPDLAVPVPQDHGGGRGGARAHLELCLLKVFARDLGPGDLDLVEQVPEGRPPVGTAPDGVELALRAAEAADLLGQGPVLQEVLAVEYASAAHALASLEVSGPIAVAGDGDARGLDLPEEHDRPVAGPDEVPGDALGPEPGDHAGVVRVLPDLQRGELHVPAVRAEVGQGPVRAPGEECHLAVEPVLRVAVRLSRGLARWRRSRLGLLDARGARKPRDVPGVWKQGEPEPLVEEEGPVEHVAVGVVALADARALLRLEHGGDHLVEAVEVARLRLRDEVVPVVHRHGVVAGVVEHATDYLDILPALGEVHVSDRALEKLRGLPRVVEHLLDLPEPAGSLHFPRRVAGHGLVEVDMEERHLDVVEPDGPALVPQASACGAREHELRERERWGPCKELSASGLLSVLSADAPAPEQASGLSQIVEARVDDLLVRLDLVLAHPLVDLVLQHAVDLLLPRCGNFLGVEPLARDLIVVGAAWDDEVV